MLFARGRHDHRALISTRHQRIDCFRRSDNGLWVLQFHTPATGPFHLASIDFTSTLSALYEDVILEPPANLTP